MNIEQLKNGNQNMFNKEATSALKEIKKLLKQLEAGFKNYDSFNIQEALKEMKLKFPSVREELMIKELKRNKEKLSNQISKFRDLVTDIQRDYLKEFPELDGQFRLANDIWVDWVLGKNKK